MSVFEEGSCAVDLLQLEGRRRGNGNPPKSLLVAAPLVAGEYPLLLLFHGFSLVNTFYSQLMQHIASHGFIVVAPQMYNFAGSDASVEISEAADLISWIHDSPLKLVPSSSSQVRPDLTKLAVIGHSRGGKVAFGLALGLAEKPMPARISALVALDPVDGTSNSSQTKPPILKYRKDALKTDCPVLIVGAALGSQRNFLFPPCAPEQVGFKAFFRDCCAPAFLFTAPQHGHLDFLDDFTTGLRGKLTSLVAKSGSARQPMRRFTAGLVVAFLRAVLDGNATVFQQLLGNPSAAPVRLDSPERYGEL